MGNNVHLLLMSVLLPSFQSTVCKKIMEKLGQDDIEHSQRRVVCISQDAFYRPLNPEESTKALKVSSDSVCFCEYDI